MRRSELVAINLEDIHNTTVEILKGKGRKQREVYVEDEGARAALTAWMTVRGSYGPLFTRIRRGGHDTGEPPRAV